MVEKINYLHNNPIKRGYVDEAIHWRYSSARDYNGIEGREIMVIHCNNRALRSWSFVTRKSFISTFDKFLYCLMG